MQQGRESESFLHLGVPSSMYTQFHDVLYTNTLHDLHLYVVCPDLFVAVRESSYGIRVEFIGSTHSIHYLFILLFYCIFCVKSTLTQLRKQKSYSHNNKTVAFLQK